MFQRPSHFTRCRVFFRPLFVARVFPFQIFSHVQRERRALRSYHVSRFQASFFLPLRNVVRINLSTRRSLGLLWPFFFSLQPANYASFPLRCRSEFPLWMSGLGGGVGGGLGFGFWWCFVWFFGGGGGFGVFGLGGLFLWVWRGGGFFPLDGSLSIAFFLFPLFLLTYPNRSPLKWTSFHLVSTGI